MSCDDLTYDTFAIGCKSNHCVNKSTTSSVHSTNTVTRRGSSRLSIVCLISCLTYCLTKLGLSYLIDRWYDDISRSQISVQLYLFSSNSMHRLIDVRVSTDHRCLVIT